MLQFKRALLIFLGLFLICGLIYPLAVTIVAQTMFNEKANGSVIKNGKQIAGSRFIGQLFTSPQYFHGRPSATDPQYDAANSGGSNLAPSNAKLIALVGERVQQVRAQNGLPPDASVPADLVLTSASGLDPHISPESAAVQVSRVAGERHIPEGELDKMIRQNTEKPLLGLWGKERLNVLLLNLALEGLEPKR